jgi:glutamyl-tRNA synthetase
MAQVRVRFAPSPTGIPHIGNTRTALYNYLFARRYRGKFILRIEDTDQERLVPQSLPKILEILEFIGLRWDEGPDVGGPHEPYIQSKRLRIYKKFAHQLVAQKKAYYCFCSPLRLKRMRTAQQKKGLPPKYDRHCLNLKPDEITRLKKKKKYCLRLLVPSQGQTCWNDLIQGRICFKNKDIDDQVILKSDGFPTYHLSVVVDDYLMKISHILRGAEWISSTPKHLLLYQALGWRPPKIGHFPIILGPDKTKLSKRHGAQSALNFRDQGYLPEALVNFMVFLGWSYRDNSDILNLKQLTRIFSLKRIQKANAIFDIKKLDWFNSQHIKEKSTDELFEALKPWFPKKSNRFYIKQTIPLIRERLTRLSDFLPLTDFFFKKIKFHFRLLPQKRPEPDVLLEQLIETSRALKALSAWSKRKIEKIIRSLSLKEEWSPNQFFMLLRVAVTGKTATPPLFETLEVLGKKEVIKRLKTAERTIKKSFPSH